MNRKILNWTGLFGLIVLTTSCGGASSDGNDNSSIYKIIADAGRNDYISRESRVELDASGSQINDHNNKISSTTINYFWTFIGTAPQNITSFPELFGANTANPSFVASVDGDYALQLEVSAEGASAQTSTVKVQASSANSRPVVNAGKDQQTRVGGQVQLDGSQSRDANGDDLDYRWEIAKKPEGSNATLDNANAEKPNFSPDLQGDYQIKLVVNDGQVDSEEEIITVTVGDGNSQPLAHAGADRNAKTGQGVTLDGGQSRDNDGDTLSFQWFFTGIPTGSSIPNLSNAKTQQPSFIPDKQGTYVASLFVNDGTVDSELDNVMVKITEGNSAPVANAGLNQTVTVGKKAILEGLGSYDIDGDELSFNWLASTNNQNTVNLTDSQTVKPSFIPIAKGNYTFELTVNDGLLDSEVDTVHFTAKINHTPTVKITSPADNATFTSAETITFIGEAQDQEDGALLESAFIWSSDKDGSLCTALANCSHQLSVGTHVITLVAKDSLLDSGEAAITVVVSGNAGPTNFTKPEMVAIPEGSFEMGDLSGNGDDAEKPVHNVTIAAFEMGKYEVTFDEYDPYLIAKGIDTRNITGQGDNGDEGYDKGWGRGNRPVVSVSWNDIQKYLDWYNTQQGISLDDPKRYRLPTEAEWEYAARAGTTTTYNTGDCIDTSQANYNGNSGWNYTKPGGESVSCPKTNLYLNKTEPVASFAANAWGLHDMHGNVSELIDDCFHDSYTGAPDDGSAWLSGDCSVRVSRGGSWYYHLSNLRSAERWGSLTTMRNISYGFRLARTL